MAVQGKRTTVILDEEDAELLAKITETLRGSETESVRRSIRALAYLLKIEAQEGKVVIRRSEGADELVSFL